MGEKIFTIFAEKICLSKLNLWIRKQSQFYMQFFLFIWTVQYGDLSFLVNLKNKIVDCVNHWIAVFVSQGMSMETIKTDSSVRPFKQMDS